MAFSNPVVGGDILIRRAIQSPNFVSGSTGWSINRDGTIEAYNAIIRGSIDIAGGLVTINNAGVFVEDATHYFSMDITGGFRAVNKPVDGSFVAIQDNAIFFQPTDPFNGFDTDEGYISPSTSSSGGNFVNLEIVSPNINSNERAYVRMWGESASGASETTFDFGTAANGPFSIKNIRMHELCDIINHTTGVERYGRGQWNLTTEAADIALTTTAAVAFTFVSKTYKAGRAYEVLMDARYTDGDSPAVALRKGTTTAGTLVVDAGRVPCTINNTLSQRTSIIFVVGASDVTTQLNISMTSLATTTQNGPRRAIINDIGPASDYSAYAATNTLS